MSRSTTRPSFTANGRTVNSRRYTWGRRRRGLAAAGSRAAEFDPDPDHDEPAWADVHNDGAADDDTLRADADDNDGAAHDDTLRADNPHDHDGTAEHGSASPEINDYG